MCVERDEDVGVDSSAAVEFSSAVAVIGYGIKGFYAVFVKKFAGIESLIGFGDVVIVVLIIGFLYATAGGGVVAGHGKAEGGAIAEDELFLYEALAKGAASEDECAVMVLEATGEDFAG